MNTNVIGLAGELQALKAVSGIHSSLSERHICSFPIKSNSTYLQADLLLVCTKGVFCVEVKNWRGNVYCTDDPFWLTTYDSREFIVKSPLLQNDSHCKKIGLICNVPVNNVVLFSDSAMISDPQDNVMYISDFPAYLLKLPEVFKPSDINSIMNTFETYKKSIECNMIVDFILKRVKTKH